MPKKKPKKTLLLFDETINSMLDIREHIEAGNTIKVEEHKWALASNLDAMVNAMKEEFPIQSEMQTAGV